jgi:hypothetical protein
VNSRSSVVSGRAGPDAFRQRLWQSDATVGQAVNFGHGAALNVDGRYLRERQFGRAAGFESDYTRHTASAGISGHFRLSGARLFFSGNESEQRTTGADTDFRRVLTREAGSSLDLGPQAFRVTGSGRFVTTLRDYVSGPSSRNEETAATAAVRTRVPLLGDLGYRFSTRVGRDLTDKVRDTQAAHVLSFNGHGRFGGGRGRVSVSANSSFASNEQRRPRAADDRLRLPFAGGVPD